MHVLAEQEILHIWEAGVGQSPVDRALTILAAGFPEMSHDELAMLSIGQRDERLLALQQKNFGPELTGQGICPSCQEQAIFSLNIADVLAVPQTKSTEQAELVNDEGYKLLFRLPNSLDLAAVACCSNIDTARRTLVQRCVSQTSQNGMEVSVEKLPEAVVVRLAERMAERDPLADIELEIVCPTCGHRWQVMLDIVTFFWAEIGAQAKRLFREVHTLAQAYGWREADILSMNATRRQLYLEMVE